MDEMKTACEPNPLASASDQMIGQNADQRVEEVEQSIEEYMAALMQRCNGHSTESESTSSGQSTPKPASSPQPATRDPRASAAIDNVTAGRHLRDGAPECRDALDNFRELANINSRSQIHTCFGKRCVSEMRSCLRIFMVASLLSFAAIAITDSISSPAFLCALVSFLVASCWGVKYLAAGKRLAKLCELVELTDDLPEDGREMPPQMP